MDKIYSNPDIYQEKVKLLDGIDTIIKNGETYYKLVTTPNKEKNIVTSLFANKIKWIHNDPAPTKTITIDEPYYEVQ